MKEITKRRLKKLANHLLKGKLIHDTFDFTTFNSGNGSKTGCGTLGCAIGECPGIWPNKWFFLKGIYLSSFPTIGREFNPKSSAVKFFDITWEQTVYLFLPKTSNDDIGLPASSSAQEVGNHILKFIENDGKIV